MLSVLRNMFAADQRDGGTIGGLATGVGALPLASWFNNLMMQPGVADAVEVASGQIVSQYLHDPKIINALAVAAMIFGFSRAGQPRQ